jgi:hypothetical protein
MTNDLERRIERLEQQLRWRTRFFVFLAVLLPLGAAKATRELVVDSITIEGPSGDVRIVDGRVLIESHAKQAEPQRLSITSSGISNRMGDDPARGSFSLSDRGLRFEADARRVTLDGTELEFRKGKQLARFASEAILVEPTEGPEAAFLLDKSGLTLMGRKDGSTLRVRHDMLARELADGGVVVLVR